MHRHGTFRPFERTIPAPLHDARTRHPEPRRRLGAVQGSRPRLSGQGAPPPCRGLAERLGPDLVAIDGKILQCSFKDAAKRAPLHVVNAFATGAR